MSDKQQESSDGGFHLSTDGLNCLPCKCRKKTFHKETKISNEGTTIIEDRSSWKVGAVEELPPMKTKYSEATFRTMKVLIRFLLGGDHESLPQKRG